jgi:hypothetical protein
VAQNYAPDLSIALGQRLRILLLSPLDVVFLKEKIQKKFAVLLFDVIYNVTTWISNQSLQYFPNFFGKFGIIKLYNRDPPF